MSDALKEEYQAGWRRRFSRRDLEAQASAEAARGALEEAVAILKGHGATRVILFGSLLSGSFHPRSDIDLAVEGIPKAAFTRAFADLMMALDWPVDLKPLEEVDPAFREVVRAKGTVLYEKTRGDSRTRR